MSRLRLLHVHHGRALGGAPISLARLIDRLPRERFESIVVVPGAGGAADLFRSRGLPVHEIPLAAWYYLAHQPRMKWSTRIKHAALAPVTRRALGRLIDRIRPDLVHLNCALLPVPADVARRRGVPFVWHIREIVPGNDPRARDRLVDAARGAAARVAISAAAAEPFRNAGEVSVIHEGVDGSEWHRPDLRGATRGALGLADDDIAVVYPAGPGPYKGEAEFLEALPAALKWVPRLVVLFAGGDAAPAGRPDSGAIRRLGWRSDMPALLAAADIVAFLPTAPEGFGLPLVEAMAAGKALLGPADRTGREIVDDGVTGRLVAPLDRAAVSRALVELANSADLRAKLGSAARRAAADRFDLDAMGRAFATLFEEAAGSGSSRPARL